MQLSMLILIGLLASGCIIEPNPSPASSGDGVPGPGRTQDSVGGASDAAAFADASAAASDVQTEDTAAEDTAAEDTAAEDTAAEDTAADATPVDAMTPRTPDTLLPDATAEDTDTPVDGGSADIDSSVEPSICEKATAALTPKVSSGSGACSAVVRLDYQSLTLLGVAFQCGPYKALDAVAAATLATATAGPGLQLLGPPQPDDAWVFWKSATDFGGSVAVSARTGQVLFAGTTVWMGQGSISTPTTWEPASMLGAGCSSAGQVPTQRGFNLDSGQALWAPEVQAAMDVVAQTALLDAFWANGYVFDALVLLYPRSVGVFNPDTAEWIVLVNGGWLE